MKKYFFFALATAGLLSSCSSDDTVAGTEVENEELVPIQIGFGGGSVSVDETRGTGTVGGYQATEENKWHSQRFNLYMLYKDSMELAYFSYTPGVVGDKIFDNTQFIAPGTGAGKTLDENGKTPFAGLDATQTGAMTSGIARPVDAQIKYYPAQGNFDFYAYRIDDAATGVPSFMGDSLSIPFEIDGSQDIMVAKAIPTTAEINSLKAINGNAANADRYYSSFSARHGVQPNLNFKHLLTRLEFQVVPKGNSTNASTGIVLDSIKVVSYKTKGVLTIAKKGDLKGNSQKITWEINSTPDTLALQERDVLHNPGISNIDSLDLVPFSPIDFKTLNVGDTISVGEALLLPEDFQYELFVYGHQEVPVEYGTTGKKTYNFTYHDVLKRGGFGWFGAGYSYVVYISLWGVNEISTNVSLTGWNKGGSNVSFEPEETNLDFAN